MHGGGEKGRGRADEEERSEERREVEMVMGVKSFEGNGIINARHVAGERWR